MQMTSFLKLLNRKINQYDKLASNPFLNNPVSVTIVWVEDESGENQEYDLDKY